VRFSLFQVSSRYTNAFVRFISFFIIAFASYVEDQEDFGQSFSGWLKVCLA
jgi:hypothetical protein